MFYNLFQKARLRISLASVICIPNIKYYTSAEINSKVDIKYNSFFLLFFISSQPEVWNKKNYRNIRNFCFSGFATSLLKCRSILSLRLESSISGNIGSLFRMYFFIMNLESFLLKYKKFFKKVPFPKI